MRVLLIALLALAGIAPASAADLKILTAGAFKSAAQELAAEFEKKTGHKVTVENDTAGAVARRVGSGEYVDVVVMPPAAMAPLLGGKLVESSAKPLARVGIGVAIKQGAPVPDISTVDAFKKSLLAARAITYTDPASGGTAGAYLANLFEKLGIAAELKPKTVLVKGGLAAEKLLTGEAEIAMQPASELLAVPGAMLVGPIPLDVQTYIIYAGAVSAGARDKAAADALLAALHGPDKAALLKKKGMELP
jgi:molybdate transport system substrate-binding protein